MAETQLSRRQIVMVLLVIVILAGAFTAYVATVLPSVSDPAGSKRIALISGVVAALAAVWFGKLAFDSVQDRRRGIERGPAKVSGKFDIWFGALVAAGGITCSVLTYHSALTAGGGIWTLYYGMIAWGVVQMFIGWRKLAAAKLQLFSPPANNPSLPCRQ